MAARSPASAALAALLLCALLALCGVARAQTSCPAGQEYGAALSTETAGTTVCVSHASIPAFATVAASLKTCCAPCNAGYFKAAAGTAACAACPAGSEAAADATSCVTCSAGMQSPAPATACAKCPPLSYASATGSSFCFPCPIRGRPNAGSTACECLVGTYMLRGDCLPCPSGVDCSSVGTVAANATCTKGTPVEDETTGVVTCANGAGAGAGAGGAAVVMVVAAALAALVM